MGLSTRVLFRNRPIPHQFRRRRYECAAKARAARRQTRADRADRSGG